MDDVENKIQGNVPLAPLTTLGVGGPARHFLDADDEAIVTEALAWARSRGISVTILGGGSNVIVSDRGVDGLVVRVRLLGIRETSSAADRIEIEVGAGERLDDVVARAVAAGWAGIECLSGVPGSVGATPIQNVGAYGQEIGETITRVTAIERTTGEIATLDKAACLFAYRTSVFKRRLRGRYVVLRVALALRPGGAATVKYSELARELKGAPPSLAGVREVVLGLRRKKSMLVDPSDPNHRSVGSFFVNPIVGADTADEIERLAARTRPDPDPMPRFDAGWGCVKLSAAWLIEHAGFSKGSGDGTVGISSKHALAIVNRGGATAQQIVDFASRVRREVLEHFAVTLDAEPVLLGFDDGDTLLRG
jgi:UDP-N-acetylmuramate dehydrogenase